MFRRIRGIVTALAVMALFACMDDAISPVMSDVAAAKGGRGGGGGGGGGGDDGAPVALTEYWVYDGNMIHVAGTGDVSAVNPRVALDHFFNGFADNGEHYEYNHVGPPTTPTTSSGGIWHVDIPWNGKRSSINSILPGPFRDALVTDIDGSGADPYVFWLRMLLGSNTVLGARPEAVTFGGVELTVVENVTSTAHGNQDVTSYATFSGAPAMGLVTLTSITSSNATCASTKGRGKKTKPTTVTVDYQLVLAGLVVPLDNVSGIAWVEQHVVVNGVAGRSHTRTVTDLVTSASLSMELDNVVGDIVDVAVVVDYVYPIGAFANYVYAPGGPVSTTVNDGNVTVVSSTTEVGVPCS